jgi:phytoene dehydrogenase-like protein
MTGKFDYEAVVVGAGPNGLAAAITLAKAGCSVVLFEAGQTVGGGTRSLELTEPGFIHDVCSAIHPMAAVSPFFNSLDLKEFGLEWIFPPTELAHPLDERRSILVRRSIEETAASLGADGESYRRLFGPLTKNWDALASEVLKPIRIPRHPWAMATFGLQAIRSAKGLASSSFREEAAQALFAGMAGHSVLDLNVAGSASYGLILTIAAHKVGWPIAKGGSQKIADALAACFRSLGGEIVTGQKINSIQELPSSRIKMFDVNPRQLAAIAGDQLPASFAKKLKRHPHGPGVFKVDWALDGPIPWAAEECNQAAAVHVGGSMAEIVEAEREVWRGNHPEKPFLIMAQQSLFDPSRAPKGKHTAWAYTHVPNGSTVNVKEQIENQIERFAPGFKDRILAAHTRNTTEYETYNPNFVGGDINGGLQSLFQVFARPTLRWNPYATPVKGLFLCSASTPPGAGVHGMCGYWAATSALKSL